MIFVLKWLLPFWRRHKADMALTALFGLAGAVLSVALPLVIRHIIDGLKAGFSVSDAQDSAVLLAILGAAVYAANMAAQSGRVRMNARMEVEMRAAVFSHILSLDRSFYRRFSAGDLLARLTDDVQQKLSWFACSGVFKFAQAALTLGFAAGAMAWINPRLALWAMAPMPLLVLIYNRTGYVLHARFGRLQRSVSGAYDVITACFSGIRLVQANSKEKRQSAIFGKAARRQAEAEIAMARTQALFSSLYQYIGYLCAAFVFIGGGADAVRGKVSVGDLVAFQFYSVMLVWPLRDISQFFTAGKRAAVSAARLDELLAAKSAVRGPASPRPVPGKITSLEFDRVSYSAGGKLVLDNVSFSARVRRVALAGKIGCGKSLLAQLPPRLIEPDSGRVLINGIDIREFELSRLREQIGYVPQDPAIWTGTIRENILMNRGISEADLSAALKVSLLEEEIAQFENGLDTFVGSRGAALSGGQRQRIAVARAIAARPQILILDDCASAMDAGTADRLRQTLADYVSNAICLLASHRIKALSAAELIVVLDEGRVVEKGGYGELMSSGGLFQEIYERQEFDDYCLSEPPCDADRGIILPGMDL